MRKIKYLVVHCTAGHATQSLDSIKAWWKTPPSKGGPGFGSTPGYHILIAADGTSHRLREDARGTYGVGGHNHHSLHVCWIGGLNGKDGRTTQQKSELLRVLRRWKEAHPDAQIVGHRDLSPDKNQDGVITSNEWLKTCPNFDAKTDYACL
ncbi:N-acetylmuramoyl-L-alanine amidase [Hymenobacter lapidiphilus]|uniref:N-acetylmuramoyl-L-alanine amidase n=1 Tax=Hymenobacter sp. CCM 8763 TaxID=2303334 RepID=UPI000E34244A|nr:N-acetylmuramoyl-L-alanine amidase [Hymenobacter sp. CCM 8763]RFP65255.1 N-acetylmuramoyl-L-alanine amidase [Hymenobacter sp. CCM 8763]